MKNFFLNLGAFAVILFTASPGFASSPHAGDTPATPAVSIKVAQQMDTSTSSSIINPEFDEFVRRRPYVKFQYRNNAHARLLGLADRYLTLTELNDAITEILSSRR